MGQQQKETNEQWRARFDAEQAAKQKAEQDARDATLAAFDENMAARKAERDAVTNAERERVAKELHDQQVQKSVEVEARRKKQELAGWLRAGGHPDKFEEIWAQKYQEILFAESASEAEAFGREFEDRIRRM